MQSRSKVTENEHGSARNGIVAVSLFCGAGGLEIGACRSGWVSDLFSTDSNETFLSTTINNIDTHFPDVNHTSLCCDSRELEGGLIHDQLKRSVDIVFGGPPCDDYTRFGRRRGVKGDKGPLIFDFLRIANETNTECFVFENVPNLNQQFKDVFSDFLDVANEYGFHCKSTLLEARNFGAPTQRKRIFVVGWKNEQKNEEFQFPVPKFYHPSELPLSNSQEAMEGPYVTVGEVLKDLPDVKTPEAESILNHVGRNHRPATIDHIKTVPQGKKIQKSFRYRAPWDGLTQSLTAGLDDSTKSQIHPIFHREMSVREYARIHQFPDTWEFSGTHHNGIKQVANAVPIGLSSAVIHEVIDCFLK
jgi:DNA (cytosine-5)-methyltransferase 1